MNKFINNPDNITPELLEGYTMAYASQVKMGGENIVVRANAKSEDKVAIISMGGSGHEPAISGFVGDGMLDASVVGDVFAAPGAPRVLEALKMFKRDAGILLVVLNHSGDLMSGNMAVSLSERLGIKVKMLMTYDDISAGLDTDKMDRRGLSGCVPLYKILGAAADAGKSIDELMEIGERYNENVATLAVAMGKCTHPQNNLTISELPEGEMEIGMGQHGEGGQGGRQKLESADQVAEIMLTHIMKKVKPVAGDKIMLYLNGVGATTHMELSIVFRKCALMLQELGIELADGRLQEILTVQELSGFQMIMAKLDDEQISYLKDHKSNAPYWTTVGK
ncbi:MAG: dihydroxyacetone kinase subunit DhaK [Rikenellaceae bacterium]